MARNAVFFFGAFLLAALAGFWPTYFTRIREIPSWHAHAHGVLMLGWCLLLIVQGWLIRDRRGPVHRQLGKVSFLLFPLIVFSGFQVEHAALLREGGKYNLETLFFAYQVLALLGVFILAYVLAIAHRRTPPLHMRYMICTPLTMFDPVFARIFGVQFGVPFGSAQILTFAMIDGILLWLCYLDRNTPHRVFHKMLAVFLVVQIPTFFVYETSWWPRVVEAFVKLPLS